MKLGVFLFFLIGMVLIDSSLGRPEEGEENILARVRRQGCIDCVCRRLQKRSSDGLEIDHGMTKRFAPELALLSHYRNKRSAQQVPAICCCWRNDSDESHITWI